MKELTKNDYIRVVDAVSTNRFWKTFCVTALHTDLLLSQILLLRWRNIDLQNGQLTVGCGENTQSKPLTKYNIEVLTAYKNYREREQKRKGNLYSYVLDDDLIFGNAKGEERSFSGLSHNFRKYLKSKKLENTNISLKKLRHFAKQQNRKKKASAIENSNLLFTDYSGLEM